MPPTLTPAATRAPFGAAPGAGPAAGRPVDRYTLTDRRGTRVEVATYGGLITRVVVPDRDGAPADVVLGYDDLAGYGADQAYFGALVGRYANRIARGRFTLDGVTYTLATNNGPNALHGGVVGFNRAVWAAEPFTDGDAAGVVLRHTSPAGDEGYPGTLEARVTYTLADGALAVDYEATADAPTPVNLTQHTYWNLAGHDAGSVLGHELTLGASRYTPVDATLIPTGELRAVAGTPFDFRGPHALGARIDAADEQLRLGGGYDHNFVLDHAAGGPAGGAPGFAARVYEPRSGRVLTVETTEPGIQVYSGNMIPDGVAGPGKGGARYGARDGLALETQHFPDSPNQPAFPSTILRPGGRFASRTVFRFGDDRGA